MQKSLIKLILSTFFGFCITLMVFNVSQSSNMIIKSDWSAGEESEKKAPVSAKELAEREEKIRQLEAKKKAEQEELEAMKEISRTKRKELIQCMNERGVILFSEDDCEACKAQKAFFEDDFKDIKYVNCAKNKFTCPLRGVSKFPTWYLGNRLGIKKTGVKDLKTLARLTDCPW